MSFLRHEQIYQSDVFCSEWQSEADYRFALPLIVLMSLRPAIPRRVALLHCSLPLHRAIAMMNGVAGNRQPPLDRGWGIFSWRNGQFQALPQFWCIFGVRARTTSPGRMAVRERGEGRSLHDRTSVA